MLILWHFVPHQSAQKTLDMTLTMKMTDYLTRLFEIYLIRSSHCILLVDQLFLRIAVYKLGPHARLTQMLGVCTKIYL